MKRPIFTALILGLSLLLIINQNCTEVNLQARSDLPEAVSIMGNFCSQPPQFAREFINFIFVIDMSGSNLYNGQGVIRQGTDVAGHRFDLVESFLQQDCLDQYQNKKFSVIGFSTDVLNLESGQNCDASALSADLQEAQEELNQLRAIQKYSDNNNLPQSSSLNQMRQTYYSKAINCMNKIISQQQQSMISDEKKKNFYYTFFLTDGAPTDNNNMGLSINLSNVQTAIESFNSYLSSPMELWRSLTLQDAGGGIMQPILYGLDSLAPVNEALAQGVLGFLAARGESIVKETGQVSDLILCSLLETGLKQPYVVKKFGVVNLTARMVRGQLKADSDMDGLIDEKELELGFNPQKRRSLLNGNELMDGLCFGLSANECPSRNACGGNNALGLNACDVSVLNLSDGLDSDHDDIPDLVEILKNTSPNLNDASYDVDSDGIPVFEEIAVGRDPNYFDNGLDPALLIDVSHEKIDSLEADCPQNQQSWMFRLNQVPIVEVLPTQNEHEPDLSLDFLNQEGENVLFVYYFVRKVNDDVYDSSILMGQFVKVKKFDNTISLGQFERLGLSDGVFRPLK